ncbi:hypothetical protein JCM11251_001772 [Rhodosporidiobolus azoricus]
MDSPSPAAPALSQRGWNFEEEGPSGRNSSSHPRPLEQHEQRASQQAVTVDARAQADQTWRGSSARSSSVQHCTEISSFSNSSSPTSPPKRKKSSFGLKSFRGTFKQKMQKQRNSPSTLAAVSSSPLGFAFLPTCATLLSSSLAPGPASASTLSPAAAKKYGRFHSNKEKKQRSTSNGKGGLAKKLLSGSARVYDRVREAAAKVVATLTSEADDEDWVEDDVVVQLGDGSSPRVLPDVNVDGHHDDHERDEGKHPHFVPLPPDKSSSPPPATRRLPAAKGRSPRASSGLTPRRPKRPRASDESGRTALERGGRRSIGGGVGGGAGEFGSVTILSPGRRGLGVPSTKGRSPAHRSLYSSSSPYITSSGSRKRLKASIRGRSVLSRPRPIPKTEEQRLAERTRRVASGNGLDEGSLRSSTASSTTRGQRSGRGVGKEKAVAEEEADEFGLKGANEDNENGRPDDHSPLDTPLRSTRFERFTRSAAPSPATYLSPSQRKALNLGDRQAVYRNETNSPSSAVAGGCDWGGSPASLSLCSPLSGANVAFAPITPLPFGTRLTHFDFDTLAAAGEVVASSTPVGTDFTPTATATATISRRRKSDKVREASDAAFNDVEDTLSELTRSVTSLASSMLLSPAARGEGPGGGGFEVDSPSMFEDAPDDQSESSEWEDEGAFSPSFPWPPGSSLPTNNALFSRANTTATSSSASSTTDHEERDDALSAQVVTTARRLSISPSQSIVAHKGRLSNLRIAGLSRSTSANTSPTASLFMSSPPLSPNTALTSSATFALSSLTGPSTADLTADNGLRQSSIQRNPSGRESRTLPPLPARPTGHARSVSTSALPASSGSQRARKRVVPPLSDGARRRHAHSSSLSSTVYPSGMTGGMSSSMTSASVTEAGVYLPSCSSSALSASVPASSCNSFLLSQYGSLNSATLSNTSSVAVRAPIRPRSPRRPGLESARSLASAPLSPTSTSASHRPPLSDFIYRTPAFVVPNTPSMEDELGELGREVFGSSSSTKRQESAGGNVIGTEEKMRGMRRQAVQRGEAEREKENVRS